MDFFKVFFAHFCLENLFILTTEYFNFPFSHEIYYNYTLVDYVCNIFLNCFISFILYFIYSIYIQTKNNTYVGIKFDSDDEYDENDETDETDDTDDEGDADDEDDEDDEDEDNEYDNTSGSDSKDIEKESSSSCETTETESLDFDLYKKELELELELESDEASDLSLNGPSSATHSKSCIIIKEIPLKLSIYLDIIRIMKDNAIYDSIPSLHIIKKIFESVLSKNSDDFYLLNNRNKIIDETLNELCIYNINNL